MKKLLFRFALLISCTLVVSCSNGVITKASASKISKDSHTALDGLYRSNPKARNLANRSQGVLVFPGITKAGFFVGGMGGNGALLRPGGATQAYYQAAGLSYGLQFGAQKYGYALFLMDEEAISNLNGAGGWDIGSAPSLVVIDRGTSASLSTIDLDASVYAVFFNQTGLMAGLELQGSKITRFQPSRN